MNNTIDLNDEEKAIIIDFMCCAIGEGCMGYGGLPNVSLHGYSNENIEEQLIIIAYKLGFTQIDIDLNLTKFEYVDFKSKITYPELTKEEKAIIVDFVSGAVGEGYKGEHNSSYDTYNINEKLATIAYKLGFLRKDIGVEEAVCKEPFSKNGISVKQEEKCYYSEERNSISIINSNEDYLEITFEEAERYFYNILIMKKDK